MKNIIKIPLISAGSLVLIVVIMAIFNLCPPQGPWIMPPWCKIQSEALPLPVFSVQEKTTFDSTGGGCFPPKGDCYRIPDEVNRKRCDDYQNGSKVSWPMNCSIFPNTGCITLCNSQKAKISPIEMSSVMKLSNNPEGFRGWPWPHIFSYNGKPLVQYLGSIDGKIGNYIIIKNDGSWTQPKEIKPGTLIIGEDENYLLHWSGWEGFVNLVVLDKDFNEKDTIFVQKDQEFRSWALGAIDSKGKLHMVWNTLNNRKWSLKYASYYNNSVSTNQEIVSSNEDQYGATPWVVVDSNDVVYVFWVQSVDSNTDGFYAYLKDGKWSNPVDLTNSKQENCWNRAFANEDEVHFFEQACGANHTADLNHIIFKDGNIAMKEIIDMPFSEGYAAFEQEKIHMMVIDPRLSELNDKILKFKFTIDYKYFDGSSWDSLSLIPQNIINNADWITVDLTPGTAEGKMEIEPDGSRAFTHEEHPEVILLDGVLHVVFEYNQKGTYDAYYRTIKLK